MPGVAGDPSEVPDRHMDEPRPESIAEESERLVATWRAERPQPAASPKEVEPTHSYWNAPPPEPAPTGRRIGWLVVGIGAAGMVIFADFLGFSGPPSDPNDPGVADVAFFVSPIIAVIAAMATAAMLWVVGALRLADLSAYRARNALVAGALVGPMTYLAVLLATTPTLDSAQSGRLDDFVSFVVPVICGIGATLIAALVQGKRGRQAMARVAARGTRNGADSSLGSETALPLLAQLPPRPLQQRRPSLGAAVLGLAGLAISGLYVVGQLAAGNQALAIVFVVVALGAVGFRLLRRTRYASQPDASMGASLFRSLSDEGERTARAFGGTLRIVLIVMGWTVAATAAAIVLALVVTNLPTGAQSAGGIIILGMFVGLLVGGPLWTIRHFH